MRLLLVLVGAAALATAATAAAPAPTAAPAAYVAAGQSANGGFAEQGRQPDSTLTAWGALALAAAGGYADEQARAAAFLENGIAQSRTDADLALRVVALSALGRTVDAALLTRLRNHRPGVLVNETIWSLLALRAAGEPAPAGLVRAVLAAQARNGAFPWSRGGKPDSNDTAAAIQALVASGITGKPVRRAAAALRAFQAKSGGFSLLQGREPDAQSTAWAIQGLLAARVAPGRQAFRFLARLRRPDGSYRYSVRYATTPVWVTAQVVPALAGKPFPLR